MTDSLLICTDLDRTLIPNGPQPESPGARLCFSTLVDRPEVTLAYVSGRDRKLVEKAIRYYNLPVPDFVIGDVGTTIYHVGPGHEWRPQTDWDRQIASDWQGHTHADLKAMLSDLNALLLQETSKQNRYKLSYYVPLHADRPALERQIRQRLEGANVHANLVWSVDEPAGVGLLDILPASASKLHAIEALMRQLGHDCNNTVFCGDSGNDLEVLGSPIPAVLVANSEAGVCEQARALASRTGNGDRLYLATGNFAGMNGNYSAGMLEGISHFFPATLAWMGLEKGPAP